MKRQVRQGFVLSSEDIASDILIPRYYDPRIRDELDRLEGAFNLVSLKDLVAKGDIVHSHGNYVPKIHYGTGPYPYIRTSDIANWEIKASPKHGVPLPVYEDYAKDQKVRARDILFVHEGTYLIGAVGMVTEYDGPVLYQHHLAKFSVAQQCPFNAFYLLVALEAPIVHRQIRSKQFSADIIDSVVGRLEEVVIPYPKDISRLRSIESRAESAVLGRGKLRQQITHGVAFLNSWILGETEDDVVKTVSEWKPVPDSHQNTVFLGGQEGLYRVRNPGG